MEVKLYGENRPAYSNDLPYIGRDVASVSTGYSAGYAIYQREGAEVSNTNVEALIALSAGSALGYVACKALGLPNQIVTRSAISYLSSAACAYHGYKRNNNSIGYALAWSFCSSTGLGVALAQGYGKAIK